MTEAPSGRRRFRPGLWATICTALTLAVLIALGSWQVQRLHWKQGEIAKRLARSAAPPIDFPAVTADLDEAEFRRVRVTGRFLHDSEFHLVARTHEGQVGVQVVTPMVTSRPALRAPLMVNRGWVPMARADPASRPESLPAGEVTLSGILRWPSPPGWISPDNDPARNQWYWIDLAAMTEAVGSRGEDAGPMMLYADLSGDPEALPIGGQVRLEARNDHLQYAVTWYALAAVLVVIYVLYQLRRDGEA
jgi:surfeit locus 1 family protein